MTKPIPAIDKARMKTLVVLLCELSKHGWAKATPDDYMPLERELRALEAKYKASDMVDAEVAKARRSHILTSLRCYHGGLVKDCKRPECQGGTVCNGKAIPIANAC